MNWKYLFIAFKRVLFRAIAVVISAAIAAAITAGIIYLLVSWFGSAALPAGIFVFLALIIFAAFVADEYEKIRIRGK